VKPCASLFVLLLRKEPTYSMKQHLVLWGDIGTDRKALIAIYLEEEKNKIHLYAFPREQVTKEMQEKLFDWKNGGDFEFPEEALHWEMRASDDTILPPEIKVDKPEIVTRAQGEWSRMIMSNRLLAVLQEEARLLQQRSENLGEYDPELWKSTKELWDKTSEYRNKNELTWEQAEVLKSSINIVFDALKAFRRLGNEKEDDTTIHNFKALDKKINDAVAKLIYPDEWGKLFEVFKAIQEEIKKFQLKQGQRRNLFIRMDEAFDELRKYRKAEYVNRNKSRITYLERTLDSISSSILQDKENYEHQYEKLKHYTRGKLSDAEMKERLVHILDRINDKEKKIADIRKSIHDIVKKMARDEKDDGKRKSKKTGNKKEATPIMAEAVPVTETPVEPEAEAETKEIEVPEKTAIEEIPSEDLPAVADAPENAPASEEEVTGEEETQAETEKN